MRWRSVGVPGEHQYKDKGVACCPHCDGPLYQAALGAFDPLIRSSGPAEEAALAKVAVAA